MASSLRVSSQSVRLCLLYRVKRDRRMSVQLTSPKLTILEAEGVRPISVPPLESGDRLTRDEFERRYEATPHVKKAELIEGVVYLGSPVPHEDHGNPHFDLIGWLAQYCARTPFVDGGDNSTLRLDSINEPQPDTLLRLPRERGGASQIVGKYLEGAPEWVGEVAASSASYDLHDKREAYRRNGVREYLVWRVRDREIDWFILRQEEYQRLSAGPDGIYRSEVFPGLWLDASAMIARDLGRVLDVLQLGLASDEHNRFVETLKSQVE